MKSLWNYTVLPTATACAVQQEHAAQTKMNCYTVSSPSGFYLTFSIHCLYLSAFGLSFFFFFLCTCNKVYIYKQPSSLDFKLNQSTKPIINIELSFMYIIAQSKRIHKKEDLINWSVYSAFLNDFLYLFFDRLNDFLYLTFRNIQNTYKWAIRQAFFHFFPHKRTMLTQEISSYRVVHYLDFSFSYMIKIILLFEDIWFVLR